MIDTLLTLQIVVGVVQRSQDMRLKEWDFTLHNVKKDL